MSNIIKFPRQIAVSTDHSPPPVKIHSTPKVASEKKAPMSAIAIAQFVVALLWPLLKWVLAIDVTWQFVRMLYYWNSPGTYAGFVFLLHFSALTALTYFVGVYRPKGGI